jgi:hypothetical protein
MAVRPYAGASAASFRRFEWMPRGFTQIACKRLSNWFACFGQRGKTDLRDGQLATVTESWEVFDRWRWSFPMTAEEGFLQVFPFAMFMKHCGQPFAVTRFTMYLVAVFHVPDGLGALVSNKFEMTFLMTGVHPAADRRQLALLSLVLAVGPEETRQTLGDANMMIARGSQPGTFPTEPSIGK